MVLRPGLRQIALGLVAWQLTMSTCVFAQPMVGQSNPYATLTPSSASPYPTTDSAPVVTQWPAQYPRPGEAMAVDPNRSPTSASWIVPGDPAAGSDPTAGYDLNGGYGVNAGYGPGGGYVEPNVYWESDPFPAQDFVVGSDGPWFWQVLPDGLIYHSYWAGVHEPRMGLQWFSESDGRTLWDPTLGGRAGVLRYGNGASIMPQGWQLDIEGAALVRLNMENNMDFDSGDYRFGVPLTYGIDNWQFKVGYYHLSSHLGDEKAIREPGTLAERINYVRDALLAGASFYPVPWLRLYGETAYATNADGGAEPWEFQFGTEMSKSGPTGFAGSPFLAMNGHLRQEHDFGGDFTAQAGWLWRGMSGQVLRIGGHYFNGKSSQWQSFDESEEQVGVGIWYDF